MTSMSMDMQKMTVSVDRMNGNIGQMTRDDSQCCSSVQGMRNVMPWTP